MTVKIQFTEAFKRRLKKLSKRYRRIKNDLQPIIEALQVGNFIGDKIPGTSATVFKVRAKNSDIPAGKSGGYRVIYQVISPQSVFLLIIYAKSDETDVSLDEIETVLKQALKER